MKKIILITMLGIFLVTTTMSTSRACCNKFTVGVFMGAAMVYYFFNSDPEQSYQAWGQWLQQFGPQAHCLQECARQCFLGSD